MKTITFNIQGRHENHSGTAQIVAHGKAGELEATEFFGTDEFKQNFIGEYEGYEVFETYTDSGSFDYFYFATKK